MLELAPERLTQHAYLLETRPEPALQLHDALSIFTQAFALKGFGASDALPDIRPLYNRLMADIEEARIADLDMAQLFLHRFRHLARTSPDTSQSDGSSAAQTPRTLPTADLRPILSEPLLFLMARASDLSEHLRPAPGEEDWPTLVLTHCTVTMDGLCDRADDWPDDMVPARSLRAMIDEICDLVMLLRIEGGAEQAQDAIALLLQLRIAFEQALGRESK